MEKLQADWAVVALIGTFVGILLAWLFTQKLRKAIKDASRETIEAYQGAIKAQEALAERLAVVNKTTIEAITKERDDYRMKLHEVRDKSQAFELQIKELESRPNLSTITTLLEGQSVAMKSIALSLESHISSDTKTFAAIEHALKAIAPAIERLTGKI